MINLSPAESKPCEERQLAEFAPLRAAVWALWISRSNPTLLTKLWGIVPLLVVQMCWGTRVLSPDAPVTGMGLSKHGKIPLTLSLGGLNSLLGDEGLMGLVLNGALMH